MTDFLEYVDDELLFDDDIPTAAPVDDQGNGAVRGRHARDEPFVYNDIGTAAHAYVPGNGATRGRHARDEPLVYNDIGTAAHAYVPGNGATRGRHARDEPFVYDEVHTAARGRHVRDMSAGAWLDMGGTAANGSAHSTAPALDDPTVGAASGTVVALRPASIVDIPPLGQLPAMVPQTTDFLRFQSTRRLTWRPLLVVAALAAAAASAGVWRVTGRGTAAPRPARVAVSTLPAESVVTLTSGSDDLAELRQELSRTGHGGLITSVTGGAVEVNADIVVGARATFTVARTALLLRSDARTHVRLSAQGGELNLVDDTISSWTATGAVDTDPLGGRADIVATGHGTELNFSNSEVVGLGTDANDPGVSWRLGASGTVQDSHFSHDWRAAYAYESGPLTIDDSSFTDSEEDGALLLDPGSGSSVVNSTFANNAASGLQVDGTVDSLPISGDTADGNGAAGIFARVATGEVVMTEGEFYDNKQFGIAADGGRLSIDGAKVWANETGVSISGGADDSVTGSDMSANTQDGMYVTGPDTAVTATSDRFDHNANSGLWVADGQVEVTAGLFDQNVDGIRIAGFSHSFRAMGNTITNSIKDGVSLDVAPDIEMRGNLIDDNGASAISTDKAYNLNPILRHNTIRDNQTATRLRASD